MSRKKNGNLEGSIRKRKDGKWEARYTIGYNELGKQIQKSIYGKTRAEVSQKLNEITTTLRNGTYISSSKITLSDWLNEWLSTYASISVRPSTFASYQSYVLHHISPIIGNKELQKLSTSYLQLFFNEKCKNGRLDGKGGLTPKTIRNIYNMLHEALKQAVINKLVPINVTEGIVLPKKQHKEIIVFTSEERNKIISTSKTERLGVAICFAFSTGLRIGELCGLKWTDFDFENKFFEVKRTVQRVQKSKSEIKDGESKTYISVGEVKTNNSYRKIPITDKIIFQLLEYKKIQDKEKSILGKGYNDNGYVFTSEFGNIAEPSYIREVYSRIIKKAEIRQLKFHTIRHTFATVAIEKGLPVKVVSEILGHSSVQITMDLYCHPSIKAKRDVIEQMDIF